MAVRPSPRTRPAAMLDTPPAAGTVDRIVDDVFITPRVVDAVAQAQFAESLKAVIRDAHAQGESLSNGARETQGLAQNMRELSDRLKARLEVAGKILPTVEHHVGRAEALVSRIQQAEALPEETVRRLTERCAQIEGVAEERLTKLAERVEARVSAIAARLDEAEAAWSERERKLGELLGSVGPATEEAERRAGAILSTLERTGTPVLERLEAAVTRAEGARADLARTVDEGQTEVRRAVERAQGEWSAGLDGALSRLASAERRVADVTERSAEAVRAVDTKVGGMEAKLAGLETLFERRVMSGESAMGKVLGRIEAVLGWNPAQGGPTEGAARPGSLLAALEMAEEGRERLEGLASQLMALAGQAREADGVLSRAVLAAVERIDEVERRKDELLSEAAGRIDGLVERHAGLRAVAKEIDRLTGRREGLASEVDGLSSEVTRLAQRVDEASADLDTRVLHAQASVAEAVKASVALAVETISREAAEAVSWLRPDGARPDGSRADGPARS